MCIPFTFFFSSRRRHTRYIGDWSSDVCSSDLCIFTRSVPVALLEPHARTVREQVEPQEIQVVLCAVRQARAHMTGRLVVLTARNGHGGQARIGARHFLLKTAGQRELQTPLVIGPT